MIASLSGRVLMKLPGRTILDVHGVGYEVFISARTYDELPEVGGDCFLFVETVVRADAIILHGFSRAEEKELFLLLVTVSGIGPKVAQTILSAIEVEDLCRAITAKDLARLTTLPGIGRKTAQRLCVELGEKVEHLAGGGPAAGTDGGRSAALGDGGVMADAASALVNLGYPQNTAWQALRAVEQQAEGGAPPRVEELIRLALQALAGK
ncbi:MAG: Holliday junction branch migration protein RuvA [Desulfobulbus sp.]|jgi:Holliday junction DNA helicase RuvA